MAVHLLYFINIEMSVSPCSVVSFSEGYLVSPFLKLTLSSDYLSYLCICPPPHFVAYFLRGSNHNFIYYFKMQEFLSLYFLVFTCSVIYTYYIAYKQHV